MREQTRQQKRTEPPLDRTTLGVAMVASVLGAMVTSAVGSGFLASLMAAAMVPAVTAFLVHPGPHRRRRIGAVLTLVLLLRGGRDAVAKARRRSAEARARHRVGPVSHASMAFAGAVVALTLVELLLGHAALADRRLTLLPGEPGSQVAAIENRTEPPVIVVPERPVIRTASSAAGARVTYLVRATDAEGNRLIPRCTPPSGSRFPVGATVVRCAVTDGRGRSASARFIVRVEAGEVLGAEASRRADRPEPETPAPTGPQRDRVPPRLDLPEDIQAGAPGPVEYTATAADDRDGRVTVTCSPRSGSSFPVGRTVVVCSATDRAGNVARGSFAVVVRRLPADTVPPRLRLPGTIVREAADRSGTIVEYHARAVDDRDGPITVSCEPPSGSRFPVGRTVVRCSATDRSGNVARGRFVVVVRTRPADVTPPRLDLPADIEIGAPGVVEYTASAVDDRDGRVTVTCSPPSGSSFPVGRTVVVCSAADSAANVARGSFAVTVRAAEEIDSEPPRLELPEDAIVVGATDSSGAAVEYAARAVDRRDGPVEIDCRPPSGSQFRIGETTVRCRASDRAGNVARGSFTVLVREQPDTEPPVLRLPDGVDVEATDSSGTAVEYTATAVDGRNGRVEVECDPPSGSTFPVGETVVRCRASDRAGNVAEGRFTVSVREPADTVPPRLRLPGTITRTTTDSTGTIVDYAASAVDGPETVPIDCRPPSGSRFPVGETVVRCSASDRAANVATGEFTVVVRLEVFE